MKVIPLDNEVLRVVRGPINSVWSTIGTDCEEACAIAGDELTNEIAVEACIDANRIEQFTGRKDVDKYISELIKQHTYAKVLKFLSKNILLA